VGQNGLVWLEGENEDLAIEAINVVENESYIEGLTDRVSGLLDKAAPAKKAEPVNAEEENKPNKETENKEKK
jgi:exosome complex RNA-binding protein Rrp4